MSDQQKEGPEDFLMRFYPKTAEQCAEPRDRWLITKGHYMGIVVDHIQVIDHPYGSGTVHKCIARAVDNSPVLWRCVSMYRCEELHFHVVGLHYIKIQS